MTATQERVEIPTDVRDNSQTVTDYAFMRHHSPDRGVTTPMDRDDTIRLSDTFPNLGYTHYQWDDVNQGDQQGRDVGHRCRFNMIVNRTGHVVYLFHTEYFTRVKCDRCEYSYATHYVRVAGEDWANDPAPLCDEDLHMLRRAHRNDSVSILLSERLRIGQH